MIFVSQDDHETPLLISSQHTPVQPVNDTMLTTNMQSLATNPLSTSRTIGPYQYFGFGRVSLALIPFLLWIQFKFAVDTNDDIYKEQLQTMNVRVLLFVICGHWFQWALAKSMKVSIWIIGLPELLTDASIILFLTDWIRTATMLLQIFSFCFLLGGLVFVLLGRKYLPDSTTTQDKNVDLSHHQTKSAHQANSKSSEQLYAVMIV